MATIDIVGGGIGGLVLARDLLKRGLKVRLWEGAQRLGGLMGRARVDGLGLEADRCYHGFLPADRTLLGLIDELGLRDALHTGATRQGFYHGGRTYPLSSSLDLLRFPPLSPLGRARLAYGLLAARRVRDWRSLERLPVLEWLRELCGDRVAATIWEPLLRARFEDHHERVPATYIWSRLARLGAGAAGQGAGPLACYLEGGYGQLLSALAADVRRRGGQIRLGAGVEQLLLQGGRIAGLLVDGQPVVSDAVALTIPTPAARRLLPTELGGQSARWGRLDDYLGLACVLVVLRRRLTPYHTLNITDGRVPFTGIVETTNLIDLAHTGGYHLVYLPKYFTADSVYGRMGEEELARGFIARLLQIFPDLRPADIATARVSREPLFEPLHPVGQTDDIPPIVSDLPGLYLANAAQIYPQPVGGESLAAHAGLAAEAIVSALRQGDARRPARGLVPAAA